MGHVLPARQTMSDAACFERRSHAQVLVADLPRPL
jgi:hypothetical protein